MADEKKEPECPPYLRSRAEIEEEIRNRQARWRVEGRAEETKSARRGTPQEQDRERRISGEAFAAESEPDEAPPATHYKVGT